MTNNHSKSKEPSCRCPNRYRWSSLVACTLLGCFISTGPAQTPSCVPAPAGLISWWMGESNAQDSVGANHGTALNGVQYASGLVGHAFDFNGVNSKVELGDPAELAFTASFSIEGWIWIRSFPTASQLQGQILFRGDSRFCGDPYCFCVLPDGAVRFHIEDELQTVSCGVNLDTTPVTTNAWLHVAATFEDATGTMRVFVNGVLAAETNTIVRPFELLNPDFQPTVTIGNHGGAFDTQPFNGLIDELAVYGRTLTPEEVAAIYEAGSSGKCKLPPAYQFTYPSFSEASCLHLAGDSAITNEALRVTPAQEAVIGSAWRCEKSPATSGFDTIFHFRISDFGGWPNLPQTGGDGFGFIVQNVGPEAITTNYAMEQGLETNSFCVTFNTFWNWPGSFDPEPSDNFVGVLVNQEWIATQDLNPLGINLSDGQTHEGRVLFNGSALTVQVDGQVVLSNVVAGYETAFDSAGAAWVGFGARGGAAWENHDILDWEYHAGNVPPPREPPVIVSQPQDQTVPQEGLALFNVEAVGSEPLAYQWFGPAGELVGEVASSLTLSNVQPDQAGIYAVVVSNAYGTATSSNVLLTVAQPPCMLPAGIAAWWPGEGNWQDVVGANDATPVSGASFASGKVGHSFTFDGVSAVAKVPDAPALNPTEELTLEAWVYINGYSANDAVAIVGKDGVYSQRQYMVGMANLYAIGRTNVPNSWVFRAHLSVPGQFKVFEGMTVIPAETWHHVAMTYDGAALKLYVDGQLDGSAPLSGPNITTSQPLIIGGSVPGPWDFDGRVDELSLYHRALASNEIADIYEAGSAGKCGQSPPVATNLIVNGSFENPPGIYPYQVFSTGSSLPGWVVEDGTVEITGTYWQAAEGSQSLDLNGIFEEIGTIYQDVPTTPGQTYTLRFAYAGNPDCGEPVLKSGDVYWDGRKLAMLEFDVTGHSLSDLGWVYFEQTVIASNTTTRLRFQSTSPTFCGLTLDDVSLIPVGLPPVESPVIVSQPIGGKVNEGTEVLLNVAAQGAPLLHYQWLKDDAPLPDAINSSLALSPVTFADAGTYAVVVSNQFGVAVSSNAVLEVNRLPIADASSTQPVVISANNSNAVVVLDGSLSSDADGDPLSYVWFGVGQRIPVPIATGEVAVITLPVSRSLLQLTVNDGMAGSSDRVWIEVITAGQAARNLVAVLEGSDLDTLRKALVRVQLDLAVAYFDTGHPIAGLVQLKVFVHKVRNLVLPDHPELAAELTAGARTIIRAVEREWNDVPRLQQLLAMVQASDLPASLRSVLESWLNDAIAAVQNGGSCTDQLAGFLADAEAGLGDANPELSQVYADEVQAIVSPPTDLGRIHPDVSQADGPMRMQFSGEPGATYLIEASTDLTHWETIGVASEVGTGAFEFEDSDSGGHPLRYYRVVTP